MKKKLTLALIIVGISFAFTNNPVHATSRPADLLDKDPNWIKSTSSQNPGYCFYNGQHKRIRGESTEIVAFSEATRFIVIDDQSEKTTLPGPIVQVTREWCGAPYTQYIHQEHEAGRPVAKRRRILNMPLAVKLQTSRESSSFKKHRTEVLPFTFFQSTEHFIYNQMFYITHLGECAINLGGAYNINGVNGLFGSLLKATSLVDVSKVFGKKDQKKLREELRVYCQKNGLNPEKDFDLKTDVNESDSKDSDETTYTDQQMLEELPKIAQAQKSSLKSKDSRQSYIHYTLLPYKDVKNKPGFGVVKLKDDEIVAMIKIVIDGTPIGSLPDPFASAKSDKGDSKGDAAGRQKG